MYVLFLFLSETTILLLHILWPEVFVAGQAVI